MDIRLSQYMSYNHGFSLPLTGNKYSHFLFSELFIIRILTHILVNSILEIYMYLCKLLYPWVLKSIVLHCEQVGNITIPPLILKVTYSQNKKTSVGRSMLRSIQLECFLDIEGLVALDINPRPGYKTLLMQLIPGDLNSACPHRQFHTIPGLSHRWVAQPNSDPNTCIPSNEAVCTIFMMVFGVTQLSPNPRPTAWETDMLITKQGSKSLAIHRSETCKNAVRLGRMKKCGGLTDL